MCFLVVSMKEHLSVEYLELCKQLLGDIQTVPIGKTVIFFTKNNFLSKAGDRLACTACCNSGIFPGWKRMSFEHGYVQRCKASWEITIWLFQLKKCMFAHPGASVITYHFLSFLPYIHSAGCTHKLAWKLAVIVGAFLTWICQQIYYTHQRTWAHWCLCIQVFCETQLSFPVPFL